MIVPTERDCDAVLQREQLHFAAGQGDLERVERLLAAGYPVNRFDSLGKTPLHYAVAAEHFDVVNRLIEAGANVNAHDQRVIGNTPLRDAVSSCSQKMVKRLLDAGADPTIRGWMQMNAIDAAELRKDVNKRKILLMLREAERRFA